MGTILVINLALVDRLLQGAQAGDLRSGAGGESGIRAGAAALWVDVGGVGDGGGRIRRGRVDPGGGADDRATGGGLSADRRSEADDRPERADRGDVLDCWATGWRTGWTPRLPGRWRPRSGSSSSGVLLFAPARGLVAQVRRRRAAKGRFRADHARDPCDEPRGHRRGAAPKTGSMGWRSTCTGIRASPPASSSWPAGMISSPNTPGCCRSPTRAALERKRR